jgi:hypothetical protein
MRAVARRFSLCARLRALGGNVLAMLAPEDGILPLRRSVLRLLEPRKI